MQIDIQSRGFSLTEGLRHHCDRRLRFALGPASDRLRAVSIRLTDENGPRGGIDKRCTLRAKLPGSPQIVIAQDEADIYVAIDRAADRLSRTLSRRLQREGRDYRARMPEPLRETGEDAHPY